MNIRNWENSASVHFTINLIEMLEIVLTYNKQDSWSIYISEENIFTEQRFSNIHVCDEKKILLDWIYAKIVNLQINDFRLKKIGSMDLNTFSALIKRSFNIQNWWILKLYFKTHIELGPLLVNRIALCIFESTNSLCKEKMFNKNIK